MLELWYAALNSKYGIWVETTDPIALRAKLYHERRLAMDPAIEDISLTISPDKPTQLWLVKRNPTDDETETA